MPYVFVSYTFKIITTALVPLMFFFLPDLLFHITNIALSFLQNFCRRETVVTLHDLVANTLVNCKLKRKLCRKFRD